jgi:3-aminobutyryl-CoA ammonia-lyase
MEKITSNLRKRMSAKDAHYGGNLCDGAHMLHLFGDIVTEIAIKVHGDEGLFLRYDEVEFTAPVYAGDFIEAYGEVVKLGNTSMVCDLVATKVIASRADIGPSAADVLDEPVVVCRAKGITVVPKANSRK